MCVPEVAAVLHASSSVPPGYVPTAHSHASGSAYHGASSEHSHAATNSEASRVYTSVAYEPPCPP